MENVILNIPEDFKDKVKSKLGNGLILEVMDNIKINVPLNYLFDLNRNCEYKNIIKVGNNSKLIFIEENISEDLELNYNCNIEIILGENSELHYFNLNNFSSRIKSEFLSKAILGKDAKLKWFSGHLGTGNMKSKREIILNGEGADAKNIEIVFGSKEQSFDLSSNLIHKVPNTKGNILVKNVLKDSAKTDFIGLIRIEKNAQKSDSLLQEHSILLSKNARSNTIPSLEIEANDVRCTHSASSGQVDEEQVFYLMSKGLSKEEAQKMIVMGFLNPVMENLDVEEVKDKIVKLIENKWNN